jgi:NAD(P)-dependent dehydrogenase (short-subunit alcohol dehydrogenase family)
MTLPSSPPVAFITGGSSGIGLSVAKRLARDGAKLALVDKDAAGLERAVAEIESLQAHAIGLVCDVSDRAQVFDAADKAIKEFGPVDLVMNNAGVGVGGLIGEMGSDAWDWVMRINLMGVIHGLEAFVPQLKAQGRGHIVNTASMAGMRGMPGMGAYCASKAAVVSLSESLYAELMPLGIGVSVLCPGFVKTRLAETSLDADPTKSSGDASAAMSALINAGIPVEAVAERVVEAIAAKEFYIFTHPGYAPIIEARYGELRQAMEMAAQSDALRGIEDALPAFPGN